jgi:hypothetical protein
LKKLGIIWDDHRFWLHFGIGTLNVLTALYVHWIVSLAIVAYFIFYEWNEDESLKDKAFIDVQGGLGGIMVTAIGYMIWRIVA